MTRYDVPPRRLPFLASPLPPELEMAFEAAAVELPSEHRPVLLTLRRAVSEQRHNDAFALADLDCYRTAAAAECARLKAEADEWEAAASKAEARAAEWEAASIAAVASVTIAMAEARAEGEAEAYRKMSEAAVELRRAAADGWGNR